MRPIRCKKCNSRFYSTDPSLDTCQNCAGTHNPAKGAERDAKNIKKVTKAHRTEKPQAVDPRTGKGAGEASKTSEDSPAGKGAQNQGDTK